MAPLSLSFGVRRRKPELIRPAKPTPYEFKQLSDIDEQQWLRFHISWILFYRHDESMKGRDPVQVIREGIAQALVYFYPFAGRLREMGEKKLVVECTGKGVMFIEADADVKIEQFGNTLQPPFPCFEELLFDVPGSSGLLDSPLLLLQVTRLKCGSFILALRYNHTMADGFGLLFFLKSVGEIARGATSPSTLPVWDRHLLNARVPPQVTCNHREYEEVEETTTITFDDNLVHRTYFFGSAEISAIRNHIPPHLRCSTFEVLAACMWRCRTLALNPNPNEEVRIFFAVNARSKFNPPLPDGYYGNVFAMPVAVTTAGELDSKPLGFALELIQKVKTEVTEEYMHSLADLMVVKDKPHMNLMGNYTVSDATRVGFSDVDFGWGRLLYGGPTQSELFGFPSFFTSSRNREGEEGIVVSICLPAVTMETFVEALNDILIGNETGTAKPFIKSSI